MFTIGITGFLVAVALIALNLYAYKRRTIPLLIISVLAALVMIFGAGSGAYAIGLGQAQTGAVNGYHQWLNGTIVDTSVDEFDCYRDGPCTRHTDCDPYTVMVSAAYTDKDGHYHREVDETDYHQCPEMTKEYTYSVTYTTHPDGSHPHMLPIADHIFDAKPIRWRSDVNVPGSGSIPRGVPADWQKYKDDLQAGNSDSITVPDDYPNYILASESTILKASSDGIKDLQKAHLLPLHTANMEDGLDGAIHNHLDADKASFVCFKPGNAAAWQAKLMHYDSALGVGVASGAMQGDMHIVAIKASCLPSGINPKAYLLALKAYWLNDLGKNAIAKNGIILVLGVDDSASTIQWAQADTGMPIGNSGMDQFLQSELEGVAFDPMKVLGSVKAQVVTKDGRKVPQYICDDGLPCGSPSADLRQLAVAQRVVFNEYPFKRACMGCNSAQDKANGQTGQGYVYLKTEIPLAGGALVLTDFLYILTVAIAWAIIFVVYTKVSKNKPFLITNDYDEDRPHRSPRYSYN